MRILVVLLWLLMSMGGAAAQAADGDAVVFVWNDVLYAQSMRSGELVQTAVRAAALDANLLVNGLSVYGDSGVLPSDALLPDEGVYQGVWSADGAAFAVLVIQQATPAYRVLLVEGGQTRVLFSSEVSAERGYLVPVGWRRDGTLVLLERSALYTLERLRLWEYSEANGVTLRSDVNLPSSKGNSATLPGGWVLVGFDTVGMRAYVVNLESGQIVTPPTGFALQNPPGSIFETYPVKVLGVTSMAAFKVWLTSEPVDTDAAPQAVTAPFLHWPLPDEARSITCYPDSAWTDSRYAVECPGLATPRAYEGHEGTDIGGKPDGLPIGTPVYAAAAGLVIAVNTGCASDDISCGDSYGNVVLLEHSRVAGRGIDTWYTGYAHLDSVLVEPHAYIRDIGLPIALSGQSGFGGAHLHIEVRAPHQPARTNWLDPWELGTSGENLWVGDSAHPLAAVVAFPPPVLMTCRTQDGNNLRSGPGTEYAVVAKSEAAVTYAVFSVRTVQSGGTPGDWYHVRWGDDRLSAWIYAELVTACTPVEG